MKVSPEIAENEKKRRKPRQRISHLFNLSPMSRHSRFNIASPRPVSNDPNVKSLRNRAVKWTVARNRGNLHRSPIKIVIKNDDDDVKFDSKCNSTFFIWSLLRLLILLLLVFLNPFEDSSDDKRPPSNFISPKLSQISAETVSNASSDPPIIGLNDSLFSDNKFQHFVEGNNDFCELNLEANLSFQNLAEDLSADESSVIKSDLPERVDIVEACTLEFGVARHVLPLISRPGVDRCCVSSKSKQNSCAFCHLEFENNVDHEWNEHLKTFVSTPADVPLPILQIDDPNEISRATPALIYDLIPRFTVPYVITQRTYQQNRVTFWTPDLRQYYCPRFIVQKKYLLPSMTTFEPNYSRLVTEKGSGKTFFSL